MQLWEVAPACVLVVFSSLGILQTAVGESVEMLLIPSDQIRWSTQYSVFVGYPILRGPCPISGHDVQSASGPSGPFVPHRHPSLADLPDLQLTAEHHNCDTYDVAGYGTTVLVKSLYHIFFFFCFGPVVSLSMKIRYEGIR